MAKKPTDLAESDSVFAGGVKQLTAKVAGFYGSAFDAASQLALPYWLVKNVDHIAFLAAISSVFLVAKSLDIFNDPKKNIATLPIVLVVVLSSFVVGWILYVFVPTPAPFASDPMTGQKNQRNIACTFLLLCFFSVSMHGLLYVFGVVALFDPSDPPFGIQPIDNEVLRTLISFGSSLLATMLGIVLLVIKQQVFDRKRAPDVWESAGSFRAIGPLALAYAVPTTLAVYYLTV